MNHGPLSIIAGSLIGAILLGSLASCTGESAESRKPASTLFIGVDTSGSFHNARHYDNALSFLALYIYGHLNELGGLDRPQALFVASVAGATPRESQRMHTLHEFEGNTVAQIEAKLKRWFPPTDAVADFTPFFHEVARTAKERHLAPAPLNVVIVTDGVLQSSGTRVAAPAEELYRAIDLQPLESLPRNVTLRLAYINPAAGAQWRAHVPRHHVRLWTVDREVMKGWTAQLQSGAGLREQSKFWRWLRDNVDFRIRTSDRASPDQHVS